jgi:hypothetical protein
MLNLGLGVNSRHSVSLYDADAQAFINATALTGTTEKTAVNNLVKNLKSYGLWSKMKAIYPFVSDTYNQFSYTEDFSNAIWDKQNTTITSNSITAPNGTLTADSLVGNGISGIHHARQTVNAIGSSINTISVYLKQGSERYAYIVLLGRSVTDDNNDAIYIDLQLGTLPLVSGSGSLATINSVGNGWYKVTMPTSEFPSSTQIEVRFGVTTGATQVSTASGFIYIWGAQIEQASSASTYQPIATTPANRFVSQFKYNLKDARDLDAAFRLAFNGTWTYSKKGAKPNGTTGFADTKLIPSSTLTNNNYHLSHYSRTQDATTAAHDMGCENNGNSINFDLYQYYVYITGKGFMDGGYPTNANQVNNTNTLGYQIGSRTSVTSSKLYFNNSLLATSTTSRGALGQNNISVYLGATHSEATGTGAAYSNKEMAFSTIGDGLTDTEATNLYTSVQLFQQELSRYVGVPIVSDANAQAFLDAAVITDQTQANAVNTLVTDLKTYGLWTKMKAIYPFVGGTATTHKWNLKDPRDLDAAYRLAFSGAWTHSSTGALPNGANAYANSYFVESVNATLNNQHISFYSRTNADGSFCDMGGFEASYGTNIFSKLSNVFYGRITDANSGIANATNSLGLFMSNRTSSTTVKLVKNGTTTSLISASVSLLTNPYALGAGRGSISIQSYSPREQAFASIGEGLSDTEAANLYTAVQKYQTSLSRNV